jgi:hypothetical protein
MKDGIARNLTLLLFENWPDVYQTHIGRYQRKGGLMGEEGHRLMSWLFIAVLLVTKGGIWDIRCRKWRGAT